MRLEIQESGLWRVDGEWLSSYDPRWWPLNSWGYSRTEKPPLRVHHDKSEFLVFWENISAPIASISDATSPPILALETEKISPLGIKFELYDLTSDHAEAHDLAQERPDVFAQMKKQLLEWSASVDDSYVGKDYPEGKVDPREPTPRFWTDVEMYKPYFDQWRSRWEYRSRLTKKKK